MDRGAESTSSAKRAKLCTEKKRDALERERNELILGVANARAKAKELEERLVREAKEALAQRLPSVCADLEAENRDELMGKLPPELWEKILDENLHQNDLLAFAMTCRFFREKQKDLGRKLVTNLNPDRLLKLRKSGRIMSHSLGWFRWVCDTFEIKPGFPPGDKNVHRAVSEGNLVNYAAFQGSVEILRWLMEEKGWEPNPEEWYAGAGGSVEVLAYLIGRGNKFGLEACDGAAMGGRLEALKFLGGLDPPCPWDEEICAQAAGGGHLEVLKFLRAQNPPCPWDERTCSWAAQGGHLDVLEWARSEEPPYPWDEATCARAALGGHLDVLKWARSQDPPCPWDEMTCSEAATGGHLDVLKWARSQDPPGPWSRSACREEASFDGHQHIVDWIDQQEDESDWEEYGEYSDSSDRSYDSYGDEYF